MPKHAGRYFTFAMSVCEKFTKVAVIPKVPWTESGNSLGGQLGVSGTAYSGMVKADWDSCFVK